MHRYANKIRTKQNSKAHLLYSSADECEDFFYLFCEILISTPCFLNCSKGQEAAFFPVENMANEFVSHVLELSRPNNRDQFSEQIILPIFSTFY